jgi:large subunit ribosomal protein L21
MSETKAKKTPKVKKEPKTGGFAVIATGGKQYKVAEGDSLKIEKIIGEFKEGDSLTFDSVLLSDDGKTTVVGTPTIAGSKVTGTLVKIGRAPKVIVLKYKQKSRYYKKNGHRQPFFEVKIDLIS